MAPKVKDELAGKNTEISEELPSYLKGCKTELKGRDQIGTVSNHDKDLPDAGKE